MNGGAISKEKELKREEFLNKWCYKTDGNATKRMVHMLDMRLKDKKISKKITCKVKDQLMFYALKFSDYKIHDLRVYGMKNMLSGIKVDKLGRVDKYFNMNDVAYWKKKIGTVVKP